MNQNLNLPSLAALIKTLSDEQRRQLTKAIGQKRIDKALSRPPTALDLEDIERETEDPEFVELLCSFRQHAVPETANQKLVARNAKILFVLPDQSQAHVDLTFEPSMPQLREAFRVCKPTGTVSHNGRKLDAPPPQPPTVLPSFLRPNAVTRRKKKEARAAQLKGESK